MTDGCCAIACETGESIHRGDFYVHIIMKNGEYCRNNLSNSSKLFSTVLYVEKKDVIDIDHVAFTKLFISGFYSPCVLGSKCIRMTK